jgi:hypothetical protein
MNAGRELDALIHEKVFGMTVKKVPAGNYVFRDDLDRFVITEIEEYVTDMAETDERDACEFVVPDYSTSIADAWLVVEKMREREATIKMRVYGHRNGTWTVGISWYHVHGHDGKPVIADSLPLAICLAALKAVGVDVPAADSGIDRTGP